MSKTDVFDLLAFCCAALFAYAVWPPACILVAGVAAYLASRAAS